MTYVTCNDIIIHDIRQKNSISWHPSFKERYIQHIKIAILETTLSQIHVVYNVTTYITKQTEYILMLGIYTVCCNVFVIKVSKHKLFHSHFIFFMVSVF